MRREGSRLGRIPAAAPLCLLLCVATIGAACVGETSEARAPFEARLEVEAPDGARRTRFAAGEPLVLALLVRNRSGAPRTLELPSAQIYDFALLADGREVWRWSGGRMFAQALSELRFEPGEVKVWRETYDPAAGAARLAPGRYRARGSLRAVGSLELIAESELVVE
jgi:hypothetical protein